MTEEINPNAGINSDLFPIFKEGFSAYPEGTPIEEQFYRIEQDPNAENLGTPCCDGCTCENPHSSIPPQE